MAKSKNQYIDNKKFFEEMVKYRQSRIDAEESGEERLCIFHSNHLLCVPSQDHKGEDTAVYKAEDVYVYGSDGRTV